MSYYPSVIITCQRCGKQHEYTCLQHTKKDAISWQEQAPDYYKLCPDCYFAELREKELEEEARANALAGTLSLGQNIRKARKAAGLTQAELSERSGAPLRSIQRWEADRNEPSIQCLRRIADALHCAIDQLVPHYPL